MRAHEDTNGTTGENPCKTVEKGRDPETGKFLPGRDPGPGRPPGCLNYMTIVKKQAEEAGVDLASSVWKVTEKLLECAGEGDVAAAKLILDRLCGLLGKDGPQVAIQVNGSEQVAIGPPEPSNEDLGDYIEKLNIVAKRQGLIGDDDHERDPA